MAEWYLAQSLAALRTEINRRWPNRDKASDGAVGDTAHSARKSDHNPDWSAGGIVRAIDVDKDGINVTELLNAVVRDPRVAYVIWNRRIASATEDGTPWNWEPYSGANPHDKHVHISIKHTARAASDTSRWFDAQPQPQEDEMSAAEVAQIVSKIDAVSGHLQLNAAQHHRQIREEFGKMLDMAVSGQTEQLTTYQRQLDAANDQEIQELQDKVDALGNEEENADGQTG